MGKGPRVPNWKLDPFWMCEDKTAWVPVSKLPCSIYTQNPTYRVPYCSCNILDISPAPVVLTQFTGAAWYHYIHDISGRGYELHEISWQGKWDPDINGEEKMGYMRLVGRI